MAFFLEHEGKVVIGKDDPDPMHCPDCAKMFPQKQAEKGKLRCPHCQYLGKTDEFSARFVEVTTARVLIAV